MTSDRPERVKKSLSLVSTSAGIDLVFSALRQAVPFSAAFLDSYSELVPANGMIAAFDIPAEFLQRMMLNRTVDAPAVLGMVSTFQPGMVLDYRVNKPRKKEWREVQGYVALEEHHMFHPLAVKLTVDRRSYSARHSYLALFVDNSGRPLGEESRRLLHHLYADIADAIARSRLPIEPAEPLYSSLLDERGIGRVYVRPRDKAILFRNQIADTIAANIGLKLPELINLILLHSESAPIRFSIHTLRKEVHILPEDVLLVLMDSLEKSVLATLPPRQRQVANLLVHSDESYKIMAEALHMPYNTFRTVASIVYKKFGVGKREALIKLIQANEPKTK